MDFVQDDVHIGFSAQKRVVYVKVEAVDGPVRATFLNVKFPWLLLFGILHASETVVPRVRELETSVYFDIEEQLIV